MLTRLRNGHVGPIFQGVLAQVAEKASIHERQVTTQKEIVLRAGVQQPGVKACQGTSAGELIGKHGHRHTAEFLGWTEHGNRTADGLKQANLTLEHCLMPEPQMRLRPAHAPAGAAHQDEPADFGVTSSHAA